MSGFFADFDTSVRDRLNQVVIAINEFEDGEIDEKEAIKRIQQAIER